MNEKGCYRVIGKMWGEREKSGVDEWKKGPRGFVSRKNGRHNSGTHFEFESRFYGDGQTWPNSHARQVWRRTTRAGATLYEIVFMGRLSAVFSF